MEVKVSMRKILLSTMLLFFILCGGLFTATFSAVSASDDVVEDSWNTKTPMNYPRDSFGIVSVDGKIYAIGGNQMDPGVSSQQVAFNERYDPKTNKWTILEPMPTPSAMFSTVAYDGKIYCIGRGLTQVYDIATNCWSTKSEYPVDTSLGNRAPAPLGAHIVDGKIFVILKSLQPSDGCEMYVYDHVTDSWVAKNSLPIDALVTSSFMLDSKLMIFGVFGTPTDIIGPKIFAYNTNTDKWSEWQTPSKGITQNAVVTSGLYAPQKIYTVFTFSIADLSLHTEAYDPVSDTCTNGAGVPTTRMSPGVVVVDDVLYVIGGVYQGTSLSVNEQYIPFGYHGTLPSRSYFSLDTIELIDVLFVVVIIVFVVVIALLFFFKKNNKQTTKNKPVVTSNPSEVI